VDTPQFNLCCAVLRRLEKEGILKHLVLIGSWCLLAYKDLFKATDYRIGIHTRDMDFLVPIPPQFTHEVDLSVLLKDLDFVTHFKGKDGYMQFVHEDLILEFIVPERGKGSDKPFAIPALGINAQPLRFMDFLAEHSIKLTIGNISVKVPHPAHFALLKLIISKRRTKPEKRENDIRQAEAVLRALADSGNSNTIQRAFKSMPKSWQKTARMALKETTFTRDILTL
jgi:hypothetical protein